MISDTSNLAGYFSRINYERRVFIYVLCEPETEEIRYVGKTQNPKARISAHLCDKDKSHKTRWISSLKNRGVYPRMEIIEDVAESDWPESEKFWIDYLRFLGCRLTNLVAGGRGTPNPSKQTREKFKKSRTGLKLGPMSQEHKARIGDANRGRKISEAERERIREMGRNRVLPPDHSERISRALKGKKKPPRTEQHKARISETLKGRKPPALALIRAAETNRGKKRPQHVIAAMLRGRNLLRLAKRIGAVLNAQIS